MPLPRIRIEAFTVESSLPFPLDMLRYDSAWPRDTRDALAIERTLDPESSARERVRLYSAGNVVPTTGRWESFGWRVVSEDDDEDTGRQPRRMFVVPREG